MINGKKDKIVINSFADAIKFAEGDFVNVLNLLSKHQIFSDDKFVRTFDDKKDLLLFLKDMVVNYLNDKYSEIHNEISKLRKKGIDLTELGLKLNTFKFKLRVFKVNLDSHSFNKCISILDYVKKEVDKYKSTK